MNKKRRARMAQAMRIWSTNATLVGVAVGFRAQLNDLVRETINEAREEKQGALAAQEARIKREQEANVARLREEFKDELAAVRALADEQKNAAIEQVSIDFSNL